MDTVNELNLRPDIAYFQWGGKSENPTPVNLVQDNFQHRLKLLEIDDERDRRIANAYPSGVQAMTAARGLVRRRIGKVKVLEARQLVRQETENLMKSRRDFTGEGIQKT
ncbi:MAG: hypothetical protein PHG79_08175 [Methanosarcina sp.]|jgi:hypothetical protein|nr:hypothetical protein [Methanosarcina sp.]MDD4523222.1 hypothetical protein [Methanosarcina sp.]HHV24242.1 hypothetical protein [Methanosarcina sp.]